MFPLAQVKEIVDAGSGVIDSAGKYGAETFLAVIVIGSIMGIVALWMWKIAIPAQIAKQEIDKEAAKSARENTAQLSHAVSTCLPVISSTHETVVKTRAVADSTDNQVHRMTAVLKVGIVAIEKLAKNNDVDISDELARIHGILDSN